MKTTRKETYTKALVIENETVKLTIQEGDRVKIITDGTDYEKEYEGEIVDLILDDTQRIGLDCSDDLIDLSYIVKIIKLD